MLHLPSDRLGILPSLEVLPFFASDATEPAAGHDFPFQLKAHSSYGEISRNLLTRKIMGGIIPWEIFIADVLALPGQRANWKIPIFLHACPTELVLRESVYKQFYPAQGGAPAKLPPRLTVGIESQNSLTKGQSREWLSRWKSAASVELIFKMLPMDMMIHALQAEALDAIIAPSPWGIHAESAGLGKRDPGFSPGKFAQRLVMVCHREFLEQHPGLSQTVAQGIAAARTRLKDPARFQNSIERMSRCGRPLVERDFLEKAATLHSFSSLEQDEVPDLEKIVAELMALDDFSILPSQVTAGEQTARLLLPA
ncbi:MAG: ABC transporter substrate-binding protein [Luteolibacter sp.]